MSRKQQRLFDDYVDRLLDVDGSPVVPPAALAERYREKAELYARFNKEVVGPAIRSIDLENPTVESERLLAEEIKRLRRRAADAKRLSGRKKSE